MQSQGYTGERFTQRRCYLSGVSLMKTLHQRHISFSSLSDSTCYSVCLNICTSPQLSLLLHSSSPFSAATLNSAFSLSSLSGLCTHREFKVTLKYHTSCKVDHTCVWRKENKIVEGDIPGFHPPFSVAPLTLSYLVKFGAAEARWERMEMRRC